MKKCKLVCAMFEQFENNPKYLHAMEFVMNNFARFSLAVFANQSYGTHKRGRVKMKLCPHLIVVISGLNAWALYCKDELPHKNVNSSPRQTHTSCLTLQRVLMSLSEVEGPPSIHKMSSPTSQQSYLTVLERKKPGKLVDRAPHNNTISVTSVAFALISSSYTNQTHSGPRLQSWWCTSTKLKQRSFKLVFECLQLVELFASLMANVGENYRNFIKNPNTF